MASTPAPAAVAHLSDRTALPSLAAERRFSLSACFAGMGIVFVAALLRGWAISAPFDASDQAAMAYLIRHNYGINWLFAHDYGPALAIVQRSFAELLSRFSFPIGEASARLPITFFSTATVALTFPLLRRLHCSRPEALAGMLAAAVLPTLVSNGHYAWGYLTLLLFTGTLSLWTMLAYHDERRPVHLIVAAAALFVHCLSNCYAFALPVTLIFTWTYVIKKNRHTRTDGHATIGIRTVLPGFVLPCVLALIVIYLSWYWTGKGQLGRLIVKQEAGATSLSLAQTRGWLMCWIQQFGYLFCPVATIGLGFGVVQIARRHRLGLLGIWALAGTASLFLLVDPAAIGHPGSYMVEGVYGASVLGTLWLCSICRRLGRHRLARLAVIGGTCLLLAFTGLASSDECLGAGRFTRYTGVATGWGNVRRDTGIKAAGWYVRQYVPADAIVMPLHTNTGMEVTVAEYYLGRAVLAGYDFNPAILGPLVETMRPTVDVFITDVEHRPLIESLDDFQCVCTLRHAGQPVRFIYARPELSLPRLDKDVHDLNRRYARLYVPRQVPIPLPAPTDFLPALARYQETVRELKQAWRESKTAP